jgi:hypothetical protein
MPTSDPDIPTRSSKKQEQASITPTWFRVSGSAFTLFMAFTIFASIFQLTPHQKIYAIVSKVQAVNVRSTATMDLTDNNGMVTFKARLETTLKNIDVVAHVHDGSCTGPILFALNKTKTDGSGKAEFSLQSFTKEGPEANNANPPANILKTWFFNTHDADVIDPKTGKPASLGCRGVRPDNGKKGVTGFSETRAIP